jgi:hypothetical protein
MRFGKLIEQPEAQGRSEARSLSSSDAAERRICFAIQGDRFGRLVDRAPRTRTCVRSAGMSILADTNRQAA